MSTHAIYPRSFAPIYMTLRAYVFGWGILILLTLLSEPFLSSGRDAPASTEEVFQRTLSFLAALSYLLPNRWAARSPLFYVRLAVTLLAAASSIEMSHRLVSGVYGPKPPSIHLVLIPMEFGMLSAPILLAWRRYSIMKASPGTNDALTPRIPAAEQEIGPDGRAHE
jgi:hypothetical protein